MRKLTVEYNVLCERYLRIDYIPENEEAEKTIKVTMNIYIYADYISARMYVDKVKGLSYHLGVQNIQLSNLMEVLERLETFMIESCPEVKAVMRDEEKEINSRKREEQWIKSPKKDM